VTLKSFRGTFKSFWDLTEKSALSWYKVRTYHLVNPTFKISLLQRVSIYLLLKVSPDLHTLFIRKFYVLFYIDNNLFVFLLLLLQIFVDTYVTVPIDILITMLISVSSASFCFVIFVINA